MRLVAVPEGGAVSQAALLTAVHAEPLGVLVMASEALPAVAEAFAVAGDTVKTGAPDAHWLIAL